MLPRKPQHGGNDNSAFGDPHVVFNDNNCVSGLDQTELAPTKQDGLRSHDV